MPMDRRAHVPRGVPRRPIRNRDAKWLRTSVTKCCGNRPGGSSNHHRQVTAQWKLGLHVIAPTLRFRNQDAATPRLEARGTEARLRDRLDALSPAPTELLHVLLLPDFDRGDRIGEFWGHPATRTFAEPPDRLRGGPNAQSGARRDAA